LSGWTDWNIVLDMEGGPNHLGNFCDAPILADTRNGTLHFQPMYYYLGHFSRFLPPQGRTHRVGHKMSGGPNDGWDGLELAVFRVQREQSESSSSATSKSSRRSHGRASSVESQADLVVVVMNPQDRDVDLVLQLGQNRTALASLAQHSIQTILIDESLLQ
jgi:hypothetical protein